MWKGVLFVNFLVKVLTLALNKKGAYVGQHESGSLMRSYHVFSLCFSEWIPFSHARVAVAFADWNFSLFSIKIPAGKCDGHKRMLHAAYESTLEKH